MLIDGAVPGLADDPVQRVRRGKFRMTGAQVSKIFEPVVDEIVTLVKGQIAASGKKVNAVLMVGGFGQNAYLRETIRAAIDPRIEVMQPPNGWTAVVRGALMKGLSQLEPTTTRVKVTSRTARKHYGTECFIKYNKFKHARSKAFWSEFDGELKIHEMDWFITKGSPVTEGQPFIKYYNQVRLVSDGPFHFLVEDILTFTDFHNIGAPMYRHGGVKKLARLKADLSSIPASELDRKIGKDGKEYFKIIFGIEMTYYSAHTTYALIYKQVNYGSVTAEYV